MLLGFGIAILILSWPLLTGKTHILATAPVDPFDILRGQYISIRYEISNIQNITDLSEDNLGNTIYTLLEKDASGISRYSGYSFSKPENGDFIKGKIKDVHGNSARVEYGIEQFFFERGAEFQTRNLTVEVKVSSSGTARISRLLYNGEPIDVKYREISITD